MSLLTLCLAGLLVCAWKFPEWVKEVGILALALGILGQIIGLYSAFEGIEQAGGELRPVAVKRGAASIDVCAVLGYNNVAAALGRRAGLL